MLKIKGSINSNNAYHKVNDQMEVKNVELLAFLSLKDVASEHSFHLKNIPK